MITLEHFYDLMNRNARVTLTNRHLDATYYDGSARSIPTEFDDCEVEDFCMNDAGGLLFKIKVKERRPAGKNWREGGMLVGHNTYHFWAKVYDEGSQYGINGSNVSKLMLKRKGEIVCNYDRGWDVEPVDEETEQAKNIVLHILAD